MKIASWNVNSLKVRLPQVLQWLESDRPDVLALQETKLTDDKFPADEIRAAGYEVCYSGQKTYNGVAIISRAKPLDIVTDPAQVPDEHRRILAATFDGVRVIDLYVPNGKAVGTESYDYKLDWLSRITDYIAGQLAEHSELVVLGDFNIAPEDRDVHDPDSWHGKILCSSKERKAFQNMLALGLQDSFRLFEQPEKSYSWWDYRMGAFRRNMGLRIDLLLASESLAQRCRASSIDKTPRGWERPSDHTPVYSEFD